MKFNRKCSSSVKLFKDGFAATKNDVERRGACFGETAIGMYEKVYFTVVHEKSKLWPGSITIGFTIFPQELINKYQKDELGNTNQFITKEPGFMGGSWPTEVVTGSNMYFYYNKMGSCKIGIDKTDIGSLEANCAVDTATMMNPFFVLHGRLVKVELSDRGKTARVPYQYQEFKGHAIPVIPGWKWNPEVLELLSQTIEELSEKSHPTNITNDNKTLSEMVLTAKGGDWDSCFEILENVPHIINGIPQERAWSILHQAAFQNNDEAVYRLLLFPNCDTNIKAKQDWNQCGQPGFTLLQIAEQNECKATIPLLERVFTVERTEAPSFVEACQGEIYILKGIPYFLLAVAFMKKDIVQRLHVERIQSFLQLTEKVYLMMEDDLEYVKDATAETLYPFSASLRDECKNATTLDDLFSKIIWIYTTSCVYREVNMSLRRASQRLDPTGDDLLLCLYSLFLQSILLHWKKLVRFSGNSYRGVILTDDQVSLYTKGTKFIWMNFTSSTKVKKLAQMFLGQNEDQVMFIINNDNESEWSPRELKEHSVNTGDCENASDFGVNELVHPAAATFLGECTEISIELQKPPIE